MKERLYSLDLLRGLDMMLLVIVGPLVRAANKVWTLPEPVMGQFGHGWECFTLWDIIMPLFIFMCGAAVPFALHKRMENGKPKPGFWRHVLGRVALLWILGMVVQGNLLTFDWGLMSPYSNTLQSIAVGYLATAGLMLLPSKAFRIAAPIALALAYTAFLACGDYTEFGNFAFKSDFAILSAILPADNPFVAKPNHYTWFSTSLMFAAMTMVGYHAAEIIRGAGEMKTKAIKLFAYGGVLEIAGWAVSPWIPVIKPIYTLSFSAQAMGWCVISLAVLYVIADILKFRKGTGMVVLFGQFALAAYLCGGSFFRPVLDTLANILTQGFPHLLGGNAAMPVVKAVAVAAELTVLLALYRKLKSSGCVRRQSGTANG
jgi:predicted acyltransferase